MQVEIRMGKNVKILDVPEDTMQDLMELDRADNESRRIMTDIILDSVDRFVCDGDWGSLEEGEYEKPEMDWVGWYYAAGRALEHVLLEINRRVKENQSPSKMGSPRDRKVNIRDVRVSNDVRYDEI